MTRIYKLPVVAFLAAILGISSLNAETPVSPETPANTTAPAKSPRSLKETVPIESLGDSLAIPRNGFEVVPGKDPNGWSFILEPYIWAMGVDGTIGVKGFDSHVDYSAVNVVKHLDWGVMAKGEVRKGRWGIFADGLFAQLSAEGDPPSSLYDNANVKFQQGMAQLALAYRIIDDRRGFLDIYAGARYNYLGITVGAGLDSSRLNQIATDATDRIAGAIAARVQSAVAAEEQKLRAALAEERAILSADARDRIASLESDLATRLTDGRDRIAASLESDLTARLNDDLKRRLRRDLLAVRHELLDQEIRSVARGVRSEYRSFLNAALDAQLAQDEARLAADEGQDSGKGVRRRNAEGSMPACAQD